MAGWVFQKIRAIRLERDGGQKMKSQWLAFSHPEENPLEVREWKEQKKHRGKPFAAVLSNEHRDRFAALRRSVDQATKGGKP